MTDTNNTERAELVARGWQVEARLDGKWVPQWPVDATREEAEKSMGFYEQTVEFRVVPLYAAPQPNAALADGWISVDDRLPEPGKAVLLDIGLKTPIRAMWASKHSVEAGDECPDAWAEYDEGSDTYYCPEGWYEWNQYEETHWAVSRAAVAWMPLPAPPTLNASKEQQP